MKTVAALGAKQTLRRLCPDWRLLAMVLPATFAVLLFDYVPMYGLTFSIRELDFTGGIWFSPLAKPWHQYYGFLWDLDFWKVMRNTVVIAGTKFLFAFPAPIMLALLLNEVRLSWYKRTVQTISYLPHFVSWVIVVGLFNQLLSIDAGPVNQVLIRLGVPRTDFLGNPPWFVPLITVSHIWKEVGWGSIIYLAAISTVDPEQYEAATVDGASKWRQVRHVTLPGIMPTITIFTDPSGYPNLAQIPKVQLAFASVGDHVYAVPVSYDRDLSNPSAEIAGWLLMQKDLPAKLGMSTPDTLDDLVAALKEVKSRGLTGFNDQPMFPLGFGRPQRLVAFGDRVYGSDGSDNPSLLGMSMHLDDAGRVVPGWATQERYEGLKLVNMLWREGLIDPETFTQKSDVLHPKIANGRYAFFYGSYGDAWAYIAPRQEDTSKTRAEIDAWFEVHDLVAIPRISAAGVDSTSIAVHNPYPRRLTVLNTSIAQPAADRVMQFVDWMQTRDGLFTQYYEGWPDGTWLYDEQGTPRRNFPWNTYTEMMQVYWDYHFPYVYLFGYHWLRDLLEAGADVKRDEPWWYWLYDVQRTIYSQPGNLKLTSALGNVIPGPVETDLSPKIEDIWAKNWAKVVTAESDAQFERDYQSLIDQLMKSDWREVVAEKQQLWEQFKRDHPEVAAVTGYPTATAIAAIR